MSGPKLWGGVFDKSPDALAWAFGQSIKSDLTLLWEEFDVSLAHAEMLARTGIVSELEGKELVDGLLAVRFDVSSGNVSIPPDSEDLHGAIESLLEAKIGETAKRLHAGRSRNDQIVTVARLWLKRRCADLEEVITRVQQELLRLAEDHRGTLMPGYTHQQPAQPITLGLHLLAYFWMLDRDRIRFGHVAQMADECPLGSAALAGTSLPIDRTLTSKLLGFSSPTPNSLDGVSDRDFVGDALHACATLMQHLSRMAQEIVLFSTAEFGFVKLDQAYSTGSSVMPQKRNPDFAELIRGRTGRALGHWVGFMSMMKSLPLGYNRDQQEDKPPMFDSVSLCRDSLELVGGMLGTASFDTCRMASQAGAGYSTATGVAEALVAQGVPFRTAHELLGELVKTGIASGLSLHDMAESASPELKEALLAATPESSVALRTSEGGPSPGALDHQIRLARDRLRTARPATS